MIKPRMNGNSTSLAQTTKATNKSALIAKNTTRARVHPPTVRPDGGVFRLTGIVTTPPRVSHNTKPNEPEPDSRRRLRLVLSLSIGARPQLRSRAGSEPDEPLQEGT